MNTFKNIACAVVIACVASSSVSANIPAQLARQLVKPGAKILAGSSLALAGLTSGTLCYGLASVGKGIENGSKDLARRDAALNTSAAVLNGAVGFFGNATSLVAGFAGICSLGTTLLGAQMAKNGVKAMRMILRK